MSGDRVGDRGRSFSATGPRRRTLRSDDRAQTVLDFVIGMSVFLAVVAFTFAFVPSLVEPYTAGEGATIIVAERGAAQLVESSLTTGGSVATLSHVCTVAFFDGTESPPPECDWDANADDLHAEIGAQEFRGLNLTITRGGVVETIGEDSVSMRAGQAPPRTASVSAASRIVDIDGETYRLTLRVW